MKNLNYTFSVLLLLIAFCTKAQQDPHFSLYRYNMGIINPAYAGTNENFEALFSVRSQWTGIQDAPETSSFNFNTPLGNKVGVGLSVIRDEVFVLKETHLYADFSYLIQLSTNTVLHAGLKAGGSFLNVDLNSLGVAGDALFSENVDVFNPNFGAGLYLKAPKYHITLSIPYLLKNDRFDKDGTAPVLATDDLAYYIGAGYKFDLASNLKLNSSFLSRAVSGAPVSIDLTGSFLFKESFELGANYRLDESVTIFSTISVLNNALQFGYAYEITTNQVSDFADSTHEIILKLRL